VVRDYLEHYAGSADARAVVAAFLALAEESGASSGRSRSWSRDELYER
jgi:hypothetical protein